MARYDLYPHPAGRGLLLDLQSDLLDGMATRVVAPLLPHDVAPPPARRLNPVFDIGPVFDIADVSHVVLLVQLLSAVPAAILGMRAGSLAHEADAVTAALDMLFHGF